MAVSSLSPNSAVVLVIDPDPSAQRAMRDKLTGLGYTARSVDDYGSAIDVIATTPPDIILLTSDESSGDNWNALQAELTRWGIPVLDLSELDNGERTEPLTTRALRLRDADLKFRVDAALSTRTLQDALLAENARLNAERLHDPLTGLYNRRFIMIRVEEEVLRSTRRGYPLSCLLADIDGFTAINDTWGHLTGDAILRDMAHLVTRTMRGSDIVCRYRDDEFLVLLTDTDAEGAQIAANRLRDAVSEHNFVNQMSNEPVKLTVSVGVAYWIPAMKPGQTGTWEPQLLGLSERALKAAKQSGANRLVILQAG